MRTRARLLINQYTSSKPGTAGECAAPYLQAIDRAWLLITADGGKLQQQRTNGGFR